MSVAQVCQTQYETSCVTKYKETPVVEDVEECNKVYKKSCEYVKSGYGTEKVSEQPMLVHEAPPQVCSNKPVQECHTVPKTIYKTLPDTACERIPFEACAPDNCQFVPGEPVSRGPGPSTPGLLTFWTPGNLTTSPDP